MSCLPGCSLVLCWSGANTSQAAELWGQGALEWSLFLHSRSRNRVTIPAVLGTEATLELPSLLVPVSGSGGLVFYPTGQGWALRRGKSALGGLRGWSGGAAVRTRWTSVE